jgi:cell division septum initiation protein DivIVA
MKGDKMTKKEIIETLKKHKQRIIDWSNRMIDQYGEDAISDEIQAMNEKEIAELNKLIAELEQSGKTEKRKSAAANATAERERRVKEKIQNAINMLRMEQKEITPYQVAKMAGVHYSTARKYLAGNSARQ